MIWPLNTKKAAFVYQGCLFSATFILFIGFEKPNDRLVRRSISGRPY